MAESKTVPVQYGQVFRTAQDMTDQIVYDRQPGDKAVESSCLEKRVKYALLDDAGDPMYGKVSVIGSDGPSALIQLFATVYTELKRAGHEITTPPALERLIQDRKLDEQCYLRQLDSNSMDIMKTFLQPIREYKDKVATWTKIPLQVRVQEVACAKHYLAYYSHDMYLPSITLRMACYIATHHPYIQNISHLVTCNMIHSPHTGLRLSTNPGTVNIIFPDLAQPIKSHQIPTDPWAVYVDPNNQFYNYKIKLLYAAVPTIARGITGFSALDELIDKSPTSFHPKEFSKAVPQFPVPTQNSIYPAMGQEIDHIATVILDQEKDIYRINNRGFPRDSIFSIRKPSGNTCLISVYLTTPVSPIPPQVEQNPLTQEQHETVTRQSPVIESESNTIIMNKYPLFQAEHTNLASLNEKLAAQFVELQAQFKMEVKLQAKFKVEEQLEGDNPQPKGDEGVGEELKSMGEEPMATGKGDTIVVVAHEVPMEGITQEPQDPEDVVSKYEEPEDTEVEHEEFEDSKETATKEETLSAPLP